MTQGFERVVGPLRMRRPRRDDIDAYIRLHTDPRTYAHAPATRPDALGCRIRLDGELEHWREHGFGYLAMEELATGRVVGLGGVRTEPGDEHLNLYYRLEHASLGRGWGRLIARAVVVAVTEELPERVVRASIRPVNTASLRTGRAAGLVRIGTDAHPGDPADGPPSELFELPRVTRVEHVSAGMREEILDLWVRVNASGGSVGFLPSAGRSDVVPVLDAQLQRMTAGRAAFGVLHAPDGLVLGFGWWDLDTDPRFSHVARLLRLQVEPRLQGRNLGRVLLGGMHALARGLPGVELLRLDYRSGTGLGLFYAHAGWVETGRQPGGLRVAPGDDRDSVAMMRRVDGHPLVGDDRT